MNLKYGDRIGRMTIIHVEHKIDHLHVVKTRIRQGVKKL